MAGVSGRGCGWASHNPYLVDQGAALSCSGRGGADGAPDPVACGAWSNASEASLWCDIKWGNKAYVDR